MKVLQPPGRKEINEHIAIFQNKFDLLKQFKIPKIETWTIDWKLVNKIGTARTWETQYPFSTLSLKKKSPAIYYFTTPDFCGEDLHQAFLQCKAELSRIRIANGIKNSDYYSLSHVPKSYCETNCLYAGSVKKDLLGRIIGHLGFGANRTGALFLNRVLKKIKRSTDIHFNYFFMEPRFKSITEHVERVFQDHHNPLIGRRALHSTKNSD
jgi:hypothetical protein